MLGRRARPIEGGHQEQRRAAHLSERLGIQIIRLILGDRQRPRPGGGEAHRIDAPLDQHGLL